MRDIPTIGLIEATGFSPQDVVDYSSRLGLDTAPPPGYLIRFDGIVEGGRTLTFDLWRNETFATTYVASLLGDTAAGVARDVRAQGGHMSDITYATAPAYSLVPGPAIGNFVGRKFGQGDGAIIMSLAAKLEDAPEIQRTVSRIGFEISPPDGLVCSVAGPFRDWWRRFAIWESDAAAREYLDSIDARLDAAGVDRSALGRQRVTRFEAISLFVPASCAADVHGFTAPPSMWRDVAANRGENDLLFDTDTVDDLWRISGLLRA